MQRFNCLSVESSLKGPHLLEASAGTGKTFAVEQIFVRLLLEASLEIEEILVITFTRAATRELKERIRSNLQKALLQLQEGRIEWDYLKLFEGKKEAIQKLQDSMAAFDLAQIFTIHGFCHRMLKEFAFEAHLSLSIKNSREPKAEIPQKLRSGILDFLANIEGSLLCPEQLDVLYKKYQTAEKLADKLLQMSMQDFEKGVSFEDIYENYANLMGRWSLSYEKLQSDFSLKRPQYKVQIKGQFEKQIEKLSGPITKEAFRFLLEEEGSLFSFLSSQNRKVKAETVLTGSDEFFAWGEKYLLPLIESALDRKTLLDLLGAKWSFAAKRLMAKEDISNPDAILKIFYSTLSERPQFLKEVQNKYSAAIIDEFQDTDFLQWDIFKKLFLEKNCRVESVFLVGDPKQSIYRFRKADIYTYLAAKEFLDPTCHYCLDTNFRSSASLIGALNVLFERPWLDLPKQKTFLPYLPVQAGAKEMKNFSDEKGALHFFAATACPLAQLEILFFSFIAKEIFRLKEELSLSRFAVLVKDRYQAERVVCFLEKKGLICLTKSHMPLGETFGFQTLYELLNALLDPKDRSKIKLVLAGPLARLKMEEIPLEIPSIFFELKLILEEKGLAPFFQRLFSSQFSAKSILETIALQDANFYRDFCHGIELLLDWERVEGFSIDGLDRRCKQILVQDPEDDERVRRRFASDQAAIQVMTMHVSKGLEFDIVFALGLAASTPKPDAEKEEIEAEKMRQLYVAMTRAKRRLYVPAILEENPPDEEGTASPMQLFLHRLREGQSLERVLEILKQKASITWEILHSESDVPVSLEKKSFSPPALTFPPNRLEPSYLHSFTSLATVQHLEPFAPLEEGVFSIHTLPRGAEIGVLLHEILEDIFSSSYAAWRDEKKVREIVLEKVKDSRYTPWLEVLQNLMQQIVELPFLACLEPQDVRVEMEFLFEKSPHFIKGFMDLVFRVQDQLYLLDWKSNWLGKDEEAYSYEALEYNMKSHDYEFQASLYAEGLKRCFPTFRFGGAYYIFLRGINSLTQGIFFFQPEVRS